MRPSKSPAAAPASLTSSKPVATKRQRTAAAAARLGDVTNILVAAETPTPNPSKPLPRRTARRSLPALSDVSALSDACSSSASVTPAPAPKPSRVPFVTPAPNSSSSAARVKPSSTASVTPARQPPSAARATPATKPSAAAVLEQERSVLKPPTTATAHRRTTEAQGQERWRRNLTDAANSSGKEHVAAATARRPPLERSARPHSRKKDTRSISASALCPESEKKQSIASTSNSLEDYLKKQRAYFAEVDATELVEEEVSESELE